MRHQPTKAHTICTQLLQLPKISSVKTRPREPTPTSARSFAGDPPKLSGMSALRACVCAQALAATIPVYILVRSRHARSPKRIFVFWQQPKCISMQTPRHRCRHVLRQQPLACPTLIMETQRRFGSFFLANVITGNDNFRAPWIRRHARAYQQERARPLYWTHM